MIIEKSMERFKMVKEKIRLAIISKGVAVAENASLAEMAAKIEEIKICKTKKKEDKNNA
jgi:hypothetical protein